MSKQPKRISLADVIASSSTKDREAPLAPAPQEVEPVPAPEPLPPASTPVVVLTKPGKSARSVESARGDDRPGNIKQRSRGMSLYLEEAVYQQLRELAFTEERKMHGLILEGLDLLFKKRGLRPIKQLSELDKAS